MKDMQADNVSSQKFLWKMRTKSLRQHINGKAGSPHAPASTAKHAVDEDAVILFVSLFVLLGILSLAQAFIVCKQDPSGRA